MPKIEWSLIFSLIFHLLTDYHLLENGNEKASISISRYGKMFINTHLLSVGNLIRSVQLCYYRG